MGNEKVDLVTVAKPPENRSLLQKYDIPVDHLSYEYITRCSNPKEVERIVIILRSGEEGIFPDLIKHAEECLSKLSPNSKVLRVQEPVLTRAMLMPEDRRIIDDDIANWMTEMQVREKDLEEGKALSSTLEIPQPEIRQVSIEPKSTDPKKKRPKQKSIGACDYEGWDKFDADAELDRIDLQDERNQLEAQGVQHRQREKVEKAKKLSKESIVDKLSLTATELSVMADQERNIGNEAYRAGDYEEALIRYNSSIKINSTVNAYNNRAITNIKLQRYKDALNDCNVVLSMEYNNVTALMRRGLALENLDNNSQALVDYQTILRIEPNNKIAIAAVNRLRKPSDSKKVRMKIEEDNKVDRVESKSKSDFIRHEALEVCFCDRAPGFSRNPKPPPHYKSSYCLSSPYSPSRDKIIGRSKSQHSYFTDVKINRSINDKSQKLIIEEIPNDDTKNDSKSLREPEARETVVIGDCVENNNDRDKKKQNPIDDKSQKLIIEEIPNDDTKNDSKSLREPEARETVVIGDCVENNSDRDKKKKEKEDPVKSMQKSVPGFSPQKKIDVAKKYEKVSPKIVPEKKSQVPKDLDSIESPYEFLHVWQSLKNDADLSLHAQLLRSLAPEDLDTVIGNKLDGDMFTTMLQCLGSHFCNPKDLKLTHRYLTAFTKLNRFSIVHLFMDSKDKEVLKKILVFVEDEESAVSVAALRQSYNV